MLATRLKIRTLQSKLTTKAKQEPGQVYGRERTPWYEEHRKAVYGRSATGM